MRCIIRYQTLSLLRNPRSWQLLCFWLVWLPLWLSKIVAANSDCYLCAKIFLIFQIRLSEWSNMICCFALVLLLLPAWTTYGTPWVSCVWMNFAGQGSSGFSEKNNVNKEDNHKSAGFRNLEAFGLLQKLQSGTEKCHPKYHPKCASLGLDSSESFFSVDSSICSTHPISLQFFPPQHFRWNHSSIDPGQRISVGNR